MDVEPMQPRLQAINGSFNEASLRAQLQEADHTLHRAGCPQHGHRCSQILCKVSEAEWGLRHSPHNCHIIS